MAALYALAQHDALVIADQNWLPDEFLLSFLDDLYVVACRARAFVVFQETFLRIESHAGVRSHLGKPRVWSSGGGACPGNV